MKNLSERGGETEVGGSGSGGRRWFHDRKTTDEDCLSLDINRLLRMGLIVVGKWVSGSLVWTNKGTGEQVATIGYEANLTSEYAWLRVHYSKNGRAEDYRITLATTRPTYGGVRWWF